MVDDDTPVTAEADDGPGEPVPVPGPGPAPGPAPEQPAAAPEQPAPESEAAAGPAATADLQAEIAALKAERDALLARVDRTERRKRWADRFRSIGVAVLVVLAVICFIAANIGGWARRNFLDNDRFAGTAEQIIGDPDVQTAVSQRVTQQLVTVIDPRTLFAEVLPDRARILAVPLANAVETFIGEQVARFVASDAFENIGVPVVTRAHDIAVRVLRGETENVQIEDGMVTINLLPVINEVLQRIVGLVPEIFGRTVTLPEITADSIPEAARQRISSAIGVDLGDDFGVITIYDADGLQAAQDGLRLFERAVIALAVLTVVFAALALWLSRRRRRTLLQLTIGAAIGLVIVRRLGFWLQDSLGTRQADAVDARAVRAAGEIVLDSFFVLTAALLIALILVAVVAAVTGPYPWAVALRRMVTGLTGQGNEWLRSQSLDSPPLRWIAANREALQIGALIFAGLVLLVFDLSWVGLLVLAVAVGIFELVVYQLGRDRPPATIAS